MPKYEVKVRLNLQGPDGNAFVVLARVSDVLKQLGVSQEERDEFRKEAKSGDYNNLLKTCAKYVEIVDESGKYDEDMELVEEYEDD